MELFTGVASSAVSEIGKWVWNIAGRNISYLLFYDRKVEKLKKLVRDLDRQKNDIQQKVDAETRNGRVVDPDVSNWFANLNLVDEDTMRLEKQVKEVRCSRRCCWNCLSYKIGEEAAEKINTAKALLNAKFNIYTHEPPPPSIESLFPNRDFEELLSTKSSMDHIWEALNNEIFYIIGVYGMGGVGKTTIMKEVAKHAKKEGHYNEVIVVTVSQNQNVKKIQIEIAEQLGFQHADDSEIFLRGKILERIKRTRKILIILDDLWDFLDDLSLIGELKNLEILQLEGFEFGTVPKEFGNLTKLRCLDLLGCKGTIPRRLISRLSRLEQLYLTGVFSNWQVVDDDSSAGGRGAATFAELASLSCLTTLHVDIENPDVFLQQQEDDLNSCPWPALTDFKIVVGTRMIRPFSFRVPSNSRSKQLAITKSTYKYKWVSDLVAKAERLGLHNWSGMECLIGGAEEEGPTRVGHKLFEVKALQLVSMPDMKSLCSGTLLPNDLLLRKLSELEIRECHELVDVLLPSCMLLRTHQLIESLVIGSCDKLERVLSLNNFVQEEEEGEGGQSAAAAAAAAGGIVLLPRLQWIDLVDLPELRSVWGDDGHGGVMMMLAAGSLQNLQSLAVERCKSLKEGHILPPISPIPNKLDHFPSLRRLDIRGCDSLTYLLSWRQAKGLPHLTYLYVVDCGRMETVVTKEEPEEEEEEEESTHVLPSLTHLRLIGLPMLRSFFSSSSQGEGEQCSKYSLLSSFKSLKTLCVLKCPKLKKLPLSSSSSLPVDLQTFEGDSWEWFESLEWEGEDQSIKQRLRPVFQPMR